MFGDEDEGSMGLQKSHYIEIKTLTLQRKR